MSAKPKDWKSEAPNPNERCRHQAWCASRGKWAPYADYLLWRSSASEKHEMYDRGLKGHPQAIAYKINKKTLGIA